MAILRAATRTYQTAATVALGLVFALAFTGCGDSQEATKSAEVTILSVEPAISYPGVRTDVHFELTPAQGESGEGLSWVVRFGDGQSLSGDASQSTASHHYSASGRYTIDVLAMSEGREVAADFAQITVLDPIDLALSDVRGAPANVQAGGEVTVSFTAQNTAAGAVQSPFKVQAYLSPRQTITAQEMDGLIALGETTVSGASDEDAVIGAGQSVSPGFKVQIPQDTPTADYYIVAWANPEGQFSDTDPDNNLAVSASAIHVDNAAQLVPDLAVSDVVMTPLSAFPTLSQLSRSYSVTNNGSIDASEVVSRAWLSVGDDTLEPAEDQLLEESDPFFIAASAEKVFELKTFVLDAPIVPPPGEEVEVYLVVEVAIRGDSPEINLANNIAASAQPTIVSDERTEGIDIAVSDFAISPDSTFLNGTLTVSMTLKNEGTLDAGSFFCGIYTSEVAAVNTNADPRLTNINISSLAGGAEQRIDKEIVVPGILDPGDYYFYVVCDPQGALSDPYRSNNQAIYDTPIRVTDQADVDLYIDALIVPESAQAGDMIELVASICAGGSNATGHTRGKLWRSATGAPNYLLEPLREFDIPNIDPGECVDVSIETQAQCLDFASEYFYAIEVDSEDTLPESNETNNRAAGSGALQVSGEYCSCEPDARGNDSALDAHPLSPGTSAESLCQPERCDFYSVVLQAGESLFVRTTFDASRGALQTKLFDAHGVNELDASHNDGHQEVATFLVAEDGDYIVSVCGATTSTQNLYDIDVEVLSRSAGFDVLPRNMVVPTRDTFSVGAQLDISFRVYNLGQDATPGEFDAKVVISPNTVIGDADDISLSPASVTVSPVAAGSSVDINATVTIPTSVANGTYYLGVDLDIDDTNPANNQVASRQITIETQCYDPLEPNDTFDDARAVTPGTYSNLVACNAAPDFYKICVPNGKKMSVRVDFDASLGDIDMNLFDQTFQEIDSSATINADFEQVGVDYVNGAQCYFAKVHLLTTEQVLQTTYAMTVAVQDVDPALQCDGAFESNDSLASASSLLAALHSSATLDRCPQGDTDYYYVALDAGQTVSLRGILEPGTQPGALRLQLYHPSGTVGPNHETAPGAPIAEIADFEAPVAGTYYLQVTIGGPQRRATYRLEADGLGTPGGVDLAVFNPVIGPGIYLPGDEVRLGFSLENRGSAPADPPSYQVYLGQSVVPDSSADQELASVSLTQEIAAGDTLSVTTRFDLPDDGLWEGPGYLHIVVSPTSQTDINPANNQASTPITLSLP